MIAIGNPYGLGGTVTAGIVSALHRGITGAGAYDRYIQTDASINMGNSGGPMFDLYGNVIGINSALISPTGASVGIGLAIPAELAKPVIDSLRRGQRPMRGYLGVGLQPLDENIAESLGLPKDSGEIVRSVQPGDPAARAGIQQGDVIVSVNRQPVTPDQTVSYIIANTTVGSRVPVELIRDGRRQTVTVTVGQRPTEEALAAIVGGGADDGDVADGGPVVATQQALGLSLQTLTPSMATALNLPPSAQGRGHHRGRSEQRRRVQGPPARLPDHVGQSRRRDDAGAGHCGGGGGAPRRTDQRADAGQARRCSRSVRRDRHRQGLTARLLPPLLIA